MNIPCPRLLAAALTLVAGAGLPLAPLQAQTAPEPQKLDAFVVTGSYIPSTEAAVEAGTSPVTRIDRKAIAESGATDTADLLQKITVSNAKAVPISNNATGFTPGATAISLRGLGPEATLVLINGRRVAPYPVGVGGTTAFVDLNSIPLSAIDNIEVLKDGASALYGADAVAGVVNIRLRRGMDGTEGFFSYGNTTNRDSAEVVASIATGVNRDKVSLLVGANFFRKNAIYNRDRDYSAAPPFLSANASPFNLELSRFAAAAALGQVVTAPIRGLASNSGVFYAQSGADPANNGLRPAAQYTFSSGYSSTFNPNGASMSYPEFRRGGALLSGERKLFGTDHVKAYADFSYQQVVVENQLAPSATGDFSTPGQTGLVIPARTNNPILTVIDPFRGSLLQVVPGTVVPIGIIAGPGTKIVNGVVQRIATAGAFNPYNPFNQDIADGSRGRLAEFGNRIIRSETEAVLAAAGIKGENIAGKWNFDGSFSYSSIRDGNRNRMSSASRFNEVVNANSPAFDPRSSAYVGTTTPYNPFGYYLNPVATNAALADYATVTVRDTNMSSLAQLSLIGSTRELLMLPHGPLGIAFGGDFRREQLSQSPDLRASTGDLIGSQPTAITRAQRKIGGLFFEARIPLLPSVEASGSVRHEQFFSSHRDTTVPKVGLRWQPVARQLTVRSSYSEGFREPSLFELYSSPIAALTSIVDPRDGYIEPEQPVTFRGNRRLEAEKTNYFNAGFIWSPTTPALKGFSLGTDFWAVTRKGTVESNPQNTVLRAFGLAPGGLSPGEGVLVGSSGAISVVNAVFYNVGQTKVEGWEFSGGYQLPTDALGRWEISTVWTLVTRFDRSATAGAPLRGVRGLDSTGVGADGYLKWKGRVHLNWAFKNWNFHGVVSYTDGFADTKPDGSPWGVSDRYLVDGQVTYNFRGTHGRWLRDTKVSLGVRNVADWDPPQAYGGGGNTTGYPGGLYTSEGRFWYLSVGRKF